MNYSQKKKIVDKVFDPYARDIFWTRYESAVRSLILKAVNATLAAVEPENRNAI